MIDEDRTMQLYGYTSDDLAPCSRSMIVAVCEGCGMYRDLPKFNYKDLCRSCVKKGDKNPMFGYRYSKEQLEGMAICRMGRKSLPEAGKRISVAKRRQKLKWSDEQREMLSGENSPHWRGGITPYRKSLYFSQEYQDWRRAVFERDEFTCRECGCGGDDLRAHHILPIRDWTDPRFSLNVANGITLCDDCHRNTFGKEYEFFSKYFDIANGIGG